MKALKQAGFTFTIVGSALFVALAVFNTVQFNAVQFNENDFNIKLAKRLDEVNGEITIGRLAASVPKFKMNSAKIIKEQAKKIIQAPTPAKIEEVLPRELEEESTQNIPAPVVNEDLELSLTGGLFNKKPLDENSEFGGVAKVMDGVIEEISVSLPGGEGLIINTNERMVGNVFQYEDTKTREMKSGLFYKVKPGVFMVTLTNDSQYPGLRLEFKTDTSVEMAQEPKPESNWGMNNQNDNNTNDQYSQNDIEQDPYQNDYYQDAAQDSNYDNGQDDAYSQEGTGFNFQS